MQTKAMLAGMLMPVLELVLVVVVVPLLVLLGAG
jgi:hypothetical protein